MKKKFIAILTSAFLMLQFGIANAQITQPLYYDNANSQVSELQTSLKTLGYYSANINGTYDYTTYLAVKSFQTKNNLTVNGVFDLVTLNKLNKVLSNEPSVLTIGIKHERVTELQTYLNALGYLSVLPTGYYGTLTTTAVSNFQRDNGLAVTGNADSSLFTKIFQVIDSKYLPNTTYKNYSVVSGDNTWSLAIKFGITQNDLLKANNLTTNSVINIGQALKIPQVNVPVKPYYNKYGEYQNWFTSAQYLFPIGANATVIDYFTGKSFNVKRTIGAGHSDTETLTAQDTAIMKEIFRGTWSWETRPVIVVVNGRRLAASMAGMPHAGLDAYPADANVSNRSGNYGYGPNLDYIKGNNMDGHFDIHFLGSLRHVDWQTDERHQAMIKISANR